MAIKVSDEYTNVNAPTADYPGGSFKNATSPTATDGTPFEEKWPNDIQGFLQALLASAGITASGVPDTAQISDYLNSLNILIGLTSAAITTVTSSGNVQVSDRIIVIDASAGSVTLDLISAADSTAKAIKVQRSRTDTSTNTVTINPAGAETIGGESTLELLPGEVYELIPDGTTDYLQF